MTFNLRFIGALILTILLSSTFAEPVRVGVLAFRPKLQIRSQWQPLTAILKQALPERDFTIEAYSFPELEAAVTAKQLDFILTNPAHYRLMAHRNGLSAPLATTTKPEQNQPISTFGGVIFTQADRSDINILADIRGKTVVILRTATIAVFYRFIFADSGVAENSYIARYAPVSAPCSRQKSTRYKIRTCDRAKYITKTESFGGYQMQAYELAMAGIKLSEEVKLLLTGMPHDLTVDAILKGRADIGFARTGVLEAMAREDKLDLARLKIINAQSSIDFPMLLSTRLYPEWPFAALLPVDAKLVRKVAAALFLLEENTAATQTMDIDGFTIPADYSPVEELQRTLHFSPFEARPELTFTDLWIHYRNPFIAAFTAFILILLLAFRLLAANRRLSIKQGLIKEQSQRLKESEELLKFALEGAGDGVWDWRIQTGELFLSKRWKEMLGYREEDQLPNRLDTFESRLHPDDKAQTLTKVQDYFNDLNTVYQEEFRMRCKNGHYKWILSRGMVVSMANDGTLLRMVGTYTDISERKQTQIALQNSYDLLNNLAAQVPGVLYQYQTFPDGRSCFPFASQGIKEIYEVTPEQVRENGSPVFTVLHPDDRDSIVESIRESARTLLPWHQEYRVTLPKQGLRWRLSNARPERLDDGSILWHGFTADITEHKQVEAALLRSNADLEQFAYSISHDMRQPLRMVTGHLQLLDRALKDSLDDDNRTNLNFALDGAKRMDAMIVSLLEYSRVGRKTEPKNQVFSRESLDEALHFLAPYTQDNAADIRITGTWPQLHASRDELTRLLQNLIGNALKYHAASRPPRIEIDAQTVDGLWRVTVKDNGIGIAPSQSHRLFHFFSRLQSRSQFEGTGMGLALSRKIVEHHGGRIWVESQGEGYGSVFIFEIPLNWPNIADCSEATSLSTAR